MKHIHFKNAPEGNLVAKLLNYIPPEDRITLLTEEECNSLLERTKGCRTLWELHKGKCDDDH
jgi:hypothetical protein